MNGKTEADTMTPEEWDALLADLLDQPMQARPTDSGLLVLEATPAPPPIDLNGPYL